MPRLMQFSRLSVLLPVLALGACAPTAWEDRVQAWQARQGPGTAASFTLVDGTYKGVAELVTAAGPECPAGRAGIITIGDDRLIYPYTPQITFIAPIHPDGSLDAVAGDARLQGQIGQGSLGFTIRSTNCESRYRLRWTM